MAKRKVLLPLDDSDFSRQIIPYLSQFLDPLTHHIMLLHVSQEQIRGLTPAPPVQTVDSWPQPTYQSQQDIHRAKHPIYANQMRATREATLMELLRPTVNDLQEAGFTVSSLIKFAADPAYTILELIEQEQVDLIAMTTHARSGVSRLLFGSVAETVLHHVSIPILLLRPVQHLHPENEAEIDIPLIV